VFFNYNITKMIQAKAFHFFLLLMGSHGYVLGSSEADGKIKASAIQQDQAAPSLKEGPPWPDCDGASAALNHPTC
jgi:hypothetical protein